MRCFRGQVEAYKINGADDTAKSIPNKYQPRRTGFKEDFLDTKLQKLSSDVIVCAVPSCMSRR